MNDKKTPDEKGQEIEELINDAKINAIEAEHYARRAIVLAIISLIITTVRLIFW